MSVRIPRLKRVSTYVACAALLLTSACVTPLAVRSFKNQESCDEGCKAAYEVAVGTVTVSTPMFTPLETYAHGDRALSFGALRDEQALSRRVSKANVSIANVEVSLREVLGALAYAGGRSSSSETNVATSTGGEVVSERGEQTATRTFESPDLPGLPGPIPVDDEVRKAALALLSSSGQDFDFTPDEMATLVASLKMYMVNLEDYYNASYLHSEMTAGVVNQKRWAPYRVNFTVSAEPGWHTRARAYDAVAQVSLGSNCEVKVITAIPPQATQALRQFSAVFRQLATAIQGEGSFNRVAARAAIKSVKAAAERLEGIRGNTTFVASYPDDKTLRLRFRPSAVPTSSGAELQPLSRIVTAIVLVDQDSCKISSTKDSNTKEKHANTTSQMTPAAGDESRGKEESKEKCKGWQKNSPSGDNDSFHTLSYTTESWFEINGTTFSKGGKRRRRQRPLARKYHRLDASKNTPRDAIVPVWSTLAGLQPPQISNAEGYYVKEAGSRYKGVMMFHINLPDHISSDCLEKEGSAVEIQAPGVTSWKCDPIHSSQDVLCTFESSEPVTGWEKQALSAYVSVRTNDRRARIVSTKVTLKSAFSSGTSAKSPSGPTIGITSNDIVLKNLPLKDIPVDVLKVLVGERVTLSVVEAKPKPTSSAKSKTSAAK